MRMVPAPFCRGGLLDGPARLLSEIADSDERLEAGREGGRDEGLEVDIWNPADFPR